MTKRLLLIAYFFPPHPAIASKRMGALAHGLVQNGWDVTVITATYSGRDIDSFDYNVIEVEDPGVCQSLRPSITKNTVKKLTSGIDNNSKLQTRSNLRRWASEIMYFPDPQVNWRGSVIEISHTTTCEKVYEFVLTSSSPATSHVIGRQIKRMGLAKRWIADFRDLWTQNHYREGRVSTLRNWVEQVFEKHIMSNADMLVTVSSPLAETLSQFHPNKWVEVVTNGFEPREYSKPIRSPQFTIVYTGQLYQGRRDPTLLFEALQIMKQKEHCRPGEVKIRFFGDNPKWLESLANTYHLTEEVELCGRVSREQVMIEQLEATILLTLNWNHPAEAGTFTGKVFEYLQAERPILAVGGPTGVLSDMLEKTQTGHHVNDIESVESVIKKWLNEFRQRGNVEFTGIAEEIYQYSWPSLAKRYSGLLETVLLEEA